MSSQSPSLLRFLRGLSGPGCIVLGWQLIPSSFLFGVVVAYFGFAICVWECITEPLLLSKADWIQIATFGVILFFLCLFTINAFVRAPIGIDALELGPVYNLRPGGLDWKPSFDELDVVFVNKSDMPYEEFNVLIRPDVPVAGIAQIGNLPNVSFSDRYGIVADAYVENVKTHERVKAIILATDAGYTIYCREIPRHDSLRIVMATVGIKPSPSARGSIPPGGQLMVAPNAQPKDFSFMQAVPDVVEGKTFHYWLGSEDVTSISTPNAKPSTIIIRGSYVGGHRLRHVDLDLPVKKMES